jgi:hypothetical protein
MQTRGIRAEKPVKNPPALAGGEVKRKGRDVAQIKAVKEVAREDSLPSLEESRASVTVSGEDLSETVRQQRWEHRDRVLSECAGSIATECFQSALGTQRNPVAGVLTGRRRTAPVQPGSDERC